MKVVFLEQEPKVVFSIKAHTQIETAVQYCNDEVSWLGICTKEETNYLVHEIFIPEQEVHATTTEMTPNGLAQLYLGLIEQGVDTNQLCYHGHSHNSMGVSPSGQDNKEFKSFDSRLPFFIRSIHNKKGEVRADVIDRERGISMEDVVTQIWYASDNDIIEKVKVDVDENVSKLVSTYQKGKSAIPGRFGWKQDEFYAANGYGWEQNESGVWRWDSKAESDHMAKGQLDDLLIAEDDNFALVRYLTRSATNVFKMVSSDSIIADSHTVVAVVSDRLTGDIRIVTMNKKHEYEVIDNMQDASDGYWRVGSVVDLSIEDLI